MKGEYVVLMIIAALFVLFYFCGFGKFFQKKDKFEGPSESNGLYTDAEGDKDKVFDDNMETRNCKPFVSSVTGKPRSMYGI